MGVLVSEIDDMPYSDFARFADYYQCEPFGPVRDNLHAGIIAATVANVHRSKGVKSFNANDFMLKSAEEQRRAQAKEFFNALDRLAERSNA